MNARFSMLLALSVVLVAPLLAKEEALYRVRAKLQIIALPTATAIRLLPRLNNAYQCEGACGELQRLMAAGEAELIEQASVVSDSGVRVQSDSGPEIRWPTEFSAPEITGSFEGGAPVAREPSRGAIAPYAFETDGLGVQLKFEPYIEPGQEGELEINIETEASLSTLDGWREFTGPADPDGVIGVIRQPEFSRYKAKSNAVLRSGKHKLLGSFTCEKPQPHVIVFLLSATATRLDSK